MFKNVFGWLFATQYNVWKRFDLSSIPFFKKSPNPISDQKNNFDVFLLGIHFFVFNPNKKQADIWYYPELFKIHLTFWGLKRENVKLN